MAISDKEYKESLKILEKELAQKEAALKAAEESFDKFAAEHGEDISSRLTTEKLDDIILHYPQDSIEYKQAEETIKAALTEWNKSLTEELDIEQFFDNYREDLFVRHQLGNIEKALNGTGSPDDPSFNENVWETVTLQLIDMRYGFDKTEAKGDSLDMNLRDAIVYTAKKRSILFEDYIKSNRDYKLSEEIPHYSKTLEKAIESVDSSIQKHREDLDKYLKLSHSIQGKNPIKNEHTDKLIQAELSVEETKNEISRLKAQKQLQDADRRSTLAERESFVVKRAYVNAAEKGKGEYAGKPAGIYILSKFTGYKIKEGMEESAYKSILSNIYLNGKPLLDTMGNVFDNVRDPYRATEIIGNEILNISKALRSIDTDLSSHKYLPSGERPVFSIRAGNRFLPVYFDTDDIEHVNGKFKKALDQRFEDANLDPDKSKSQTELECSIRLAEYKDINTHSKFMSEELTSALNSKGSQKLAMKNAVETAERKTEETRKSPLGYNYYMEKNQKYEEMRNEVISAGKDVRDAKWRKEIAAIAKEAEEQRRKEALKKEKEKERIRKAQEKNEKKQRERQRKAEKEKLKTEAKAVKDQKTNTAEAENSNQKVTKRSLKEMFGLNKDAEKKSVKTQSPEPAAQKQEPEAPKAVKTPEQTAAEAAEAERQAFEQEVKRRFDERINAAIQNETEKWKENFKNDTLENYKSRITQLEGKKAALNESLNAIELPSAADVYSFSGIGEQKKELDGWNQQVENTSNHTEQRRIVNNIQDRLRQFKDIQVMIDKALKHYSSELKEGRAQPLQGTPCTFLEFAEADQKRTELINIKKSRLSSEYTEQHGDSKYYDNAETQLGNILKAMKSGTLDEYRRGVDRKQQVLIDKLSHVPNIQQTLEEHVRQYKNEKNPGFFGSIKKKWDTWFHPEEVNKRKGTAEFLRSVNASFNDSIDAEIHTVERETDYKNKLKFVDSCTNYCRQTQSMQREDIRNLQAEINTCKNCITESELNKAADKAFNDSAKTQLEEDTKNKLTESIVREMEAEKPGKTMTSTEHSHHSEHRHHGEHRHHSRSAENTEEKSNTSNHRHHRRTAPVTPKDSEKTVEAAARSK